MQIKPEYFIVLNSLVKELKNVIRYLDHDLAFQETTFVHVGNMLTSADHILSLHPKLLLNNDYLRLLIMSHDLGELGLIGDYTAFGQSCKKTLRESKKKYEDEKFKELGEQYPWILELRDDFENSKTPEAVFANLLDKYDSLLHIPKCGIDKLTADQARFSISYHISAIERFKEKTKKFSILSDIIPFIENELDKFKNAFELYGY